MSMATRTTHRGKPVWVTEGRAELPLLNIAVSAALMIREPDRYSLDRILGILLPAWVGPLVLLGWQVEARRGRSLPGRRGRRGTLRKAFMVRGSSSAGIILG
jgi:hypothetical protein